MKKKSPTISEPPAAKVKVAAPPEQSKGVNKTSIPAYPHQVVKGFAGMTSTQQQGFPGGNQSFQRSNLSSNTAVSVVQGSYQPHSPNAIQNTITQPPPPPPPPAGLLSLDPNFTKPFIPTLPVVPKCEEEKLESSSESNPVKAPEKTQPSISTSTAEPSVPRSTVQPSVSPVTGEAPTPGDLKSQPTDNLSPSKILKIPIGLPPPSVILKQKSNAKPENEVKVTKPLSMNGADEKSKPPAQALQKDSQECNASAENNASKEISPSKSPPKEKVNEPSPKEVPKSKAPIPKDLPSPEANEQEKMSS